jgi:hypothetical protein
MAELLHRSNPDLSIRSDGRTVFGLLVPYGQTASVYEDGRSYYERFVSGAFARTIADRGNRIKLLVNHDRLTGLIGRWTDLRESGAGLEGEARISKTAKGDDALELVRDGALDAFSVGFRPIKHRIADDNAVERTEAALAEVSLTPFPAYDGALVGGLRNSIPYDPSTDRERQRYALSIKGLLK